MTWLLGKTRQKGGFTPEQNFHGLWDKFAGFYPAWVPTEAIPCRNPGPELPIVGATRSEQFSVCPSTPRGAQPFVAAQHTLVLLRNRDGFNDTRMIASIVASVRFLQTCRGLTGHTLLCTAIAVVPSFFPA